MQYSFDTDDCQDDALAELQSRIHAETATLQHLEHRIDAASSDLEEPFLSCEQAQPQQYVLLPIQTSASLTSARRQSHRFKRQKRHTAGRVPFSLEEVNAVLELHVLKEVDNALELPRYTAPQRRQV